MHSLREQKERDRKEETERKRKIGETEIKR